MFFNTKAEVLSELKSIVEKAGFKSKKKNEFTKAASTKSESIYSARLPFDLLDLESIPIKDCFILRNNMLLDKDVIITPIKVENTRSSIRSIPYIANSMTRNCGNKYDYMLFLYTLKTEKLPDPIDRLYIRGNVLHSYSNFISAFDSNIALGELKNLLNGRSIDKSMDESQFTKAEIEVEAEEDKIDLDIDAEEDSLMSIS